MKILAILVLFVLPLFVDAGGIKFKDCGSKTGTIKDVYIQGCSVQPCILKKGSNVTFSVDFMTKAAVTNATAVVHGIVEGVKIPFPIPQSDGCTNCGLTCPLKAGSSNSYQTYIPVKTAYPALEVPVQWELKDENGDDVFCMVVIVKIQ